MKSTVSSLVFFLITFLSYFVAAAPLEVARDVYVPHVLEPTDGAVWKVGTKQRVTWDISAPPERITNPTAKIILVKDNILDYENPLVTIPILDGSVEVEVPDKPGDNFQVIVFGDSGNTSGRFKIIK